MSGTKNAVTAWLAEDDKLAQKFFTAYERAARDFEHAQQQKYPGTEFELSMEQVASCLRLAMADLPAKKQLDLDVPGVMNGLLAAVTATAQAAPKPKTIQRRRVRDVLIAAAVRVLAFIKSVPTRITNAVKRIIRAIKLRFDALIAAMAARRAKRKAQRETEAAAAAAEAATA